MDPDALRAQHNTIAHWILDEHCTSTLNDAPAPPLGLTPADRAVDLAARSLRDQEARLLAHHAAADRLARQTVLGILQQRQRGAYHVDFYHGLSPFGPAGSPGFDPEATTTRDEAPVSVEGPAGTGGAPGPGPRTFRRPRAAHRRPADHNDATA